MEQNNLIAELIPMYQKFIANKKATEEKAAAKLRPEKEENISLEEEVEEAEVDG